MLCTYYCVMSTARHYEWKELARFSELNEAENALAYFRDRGYLNACIEIDIEF